MKCILVLLGLLIMVETRGLEIPPYPLSRKTLIEISDILYEGLGSIAENTTAYTSETLRIENSLLYLYSDISNAVNNNRFINLLQEIFKRANTSSIKECQQVYDIALNAFVMDHYKHIYADVTQNLKHLRESSISVMKVAEKIRNQIHDDLENEIDLCEKDYKKCRITGEYITEIEFLAPLLDDLDYFMDILFRDRLYVKRIYARTYYSQIWGRIFVPVHDCLISVDFLRESK